MIVKIIIFEYFVSFKDSYIICYVNLVEIDVRVQIIVISIEFFVCLR